MPPCGSCQAPGTSLRSNAMTCPLALVTTATTPARNCMLGIEAMVPVPTATPDGSATERAQPLVDVGELRVDLGDRRRTSAGR